jgi:hypothetical protein
LFVLDEPGGLCDYLIVLVCREGAVAAPIIQNLGQGLWQSIEPAVTCACDWLNLVVTARASTVGWPVETLRSRSEAKLKPQVGKLGTIPFAPGK